MEWRYQMTDKRGCSTGARRKVPSAHTVRASAQCCTPWPSWRQGRNWVCAGLQQAPAPKGIYAGALCTDPHGGLPRQPIFAR